MTRLHASAPRSTEPDHAGPRSVTGIPERLETERLLLRRWQRDDAVQLSLVLEANVEHLKPWIPWSVADPGTLTLLEQRLDAYSSSFDAGREYLYAVMTPDDVTLLGGVGLYPRDRDRRVSERDADRAEIGYWIRRDAIGRGFAAEAVRGILRVARSIPRFETVEIRCDPRNAASCAIPKRLGFRMSGPSLADDPDAPTARTVVWTCDDEAP